MFPPEYDVSFITQYSNGDVQQALHGVLAYFEKLQCRPLCRVGVQEIELLCAVVDILFGKALFAEASNMIYYFFDWVEMHPEHKKSQTHIRMLFHKAHLVDVYGDFEIVRDIYAELAALFAADGPGNPLEPFLEPAVGALRRKYEKVAA